MPQHPWEHIADELSRQGWSWGIVRAFLGGRLLWVADAHRDDGQRYVVHAASKARAFEELQKVTATIRVAK